MEFTYSMLLRLFLTDLLLQTGVVSQTTGGSANVTDFAKLLLKTELLRGSRWLLEYNGEIEVFHSVHLVDISRVDVTTMSLRVELYLRQKWVATNLLFPPGLFEDTDKADTHITAGSTVLKSVWSPDSYFPNARDTSKKNVASKIFGHLWDQGWNEPGYYNNKPNPQGF